MMAIDSSDRNRGYRTSSFTIESKTSSSSSPGKGDWKEVEKISQLEFFKPFLLQMKIQQNSLIWKVILQKS
jgi:hypothetical protein